MTTVSSDAGPSSGAHLGDLLERARTGDRAALQDLVHELNPLLWHVARAEGLNAEDAADAVQTAWLALLRGLDEIRSPEAVSGWLVTAVRRDSWHRRNRSRRDLYDVDALLENTADAGPAPEEHLLTDERDRALWRHIAHLPERCRRLLRVLCQVDQPDYARIAASLGMPPGSIGPTRGRCLAKLRKTLLADPTWSA
jgi:RNA polymerase sigma factor (sigma-70 family)